MKVKLTKWGNSMGIRLPAEAVKLAGLQAGSELRVKANEKRGVIMLEPIKQPRKGWEAAFNKAADNNEDDLLIDDGLETAFDKEEWKW